MLDPKHLKAIKKSAQREQWSAVGDTLRTLSAQAASNPMDAIRVKGLIPIIQERNVEDLAWAIDRLLAIKNQPD